MQGPFLGVLNSSLDLGSCEVGVIITIPFTVRRLRFREVKPLAQYYRVLAGISEQARSL